MNKEDELDTNPIPRWIFNDGFQLYVAYPGQQIIIHANTEGAGTRAIIALRITFVKFSAITTKIRCSSRDNLLLHQSADNNHTCQLSRFRGFLPITRSQQKISRYQTLAQDFLTLKINQFFEKLINFVGESFFFFQKRKEYSSTHAATDFIFFKSSNLI